MLETNTRGTEIFPMNEPIKGRKPYSRLHGLPLVVAAIFVGLAGLLAAPESSAPVPDRPAVVEVTPTPETSEPPVTPPPVTPAPPVTPPPVTPAPVTISPEPVTPTPGEPTDPPFNPYYPPVTRPPVTPRPPVVDPTPTYKAPALNGVSSQMGNIDGAVDYFIYGFDLTHNDVDLEKGVSVTMQVRDIGASGWSTPDATYITVPVITYTGDTGARLRYDSADIPIPTGEIGAIQEVQLVFDYTLTDGSTAGQIQSWSVGPLFAYAGSFVHPGNANTTDSEITASFPLLSALPNPSGSTVSLGGVELIPPTGGTPIVLDADSATVSVDASGGSPTVSVTVSTGDADPGDYVLRAYFVYEDEANNFPAWYSAGQADVTVPVHYDAPEFVADATGGEFDGESEANIFFALTLNDAVGQEGQAVLYRKNAEGEYTAVEDAAAMDYEGDGTADNPWEGSLYDWQEPPMLQWYKVRFNYAFPDEEYGSSGRYIESDEFPVWGGEFLYPDDENSGMGASGLTAAFTVDEVIPDVSRLTASAVLYCPDGASHDSVDVSSLVTIGSDGTVEVNMDFAKDMPEGYVGAPGDYTVELTLTYEEDPISWPSTAEITLTVYLEPEFGSVQGEYNGDTADISFSITLNGAAGQEGTATLYKKNDEGSYEALDGVDMTYEGGDATEWPGESGEPLSDAGVAGDGIDWYKVVFEFELPNGNTGSIESDPIPVTHGHYLSATGTPTVFSGFRAEFTIDDKVVDPAGVDPEKITAELETGEGTIDVSGYVSVSDNTITVEALFYEDLHITAPKLGELWTLTVSTVYEADTDDGSVTWPDNAMHTLTVQPAPFEAPEPGTLSTDPVGGDVQTVSAPLTLKSAQGGSVTAQLGELSDGAFHDLYGQTLSISGEESEVVSWTAQFEDFDLASLTEKDGCIVVPVVVRFGYEYSEYVDVPGEGPFSAYTDPLTLYYGNYLLGGEGTDEFYFNEEITAEFPLHEALPDPSGDTLSIVKVEVVSMDGEESVDVTDEAKAAGLSVEERDGRTVAVVSFTTEKELFLGYCRLMVTLSYTDDDIAGWQSASFADLDLMEPQQSVTFTAPVPGTPTMEHIDNDDKDQHIINVTAPLTLNSAAAAGSSVTAELGWTSNNTFRAFEYADSAPTYTGDGSTSWSPRIVYDAGAAASDLYAPMILQPAVVRFTYECAGAPADDPGYADTDPFLLYWGNYLSYMYPGKDPDDSIAYFVLDDDFAGSQYIDLANLSIASVQLMEEDGETLLRTLDPSLYSIFREDGMVGMRYSLPDDLPSSYYMLRVTLSYSDSAWGIDNWTSSDGMGFDYEAPAVGDPLFTYVYGYAENADEAIVQAEFGMDLRSAAGLPGTAVLQRWSGPLLGIGKYQFEDTNFTVDYDSDDRNWNEYIFGGFPMDYGFAGTFRIAYYYTDSDGESRAVYSNEFLVYTGTFIGQGDFTYGNGYFGGSSELLFGLSFSDLTNVTITVYDDNREPVDISGLTPRGGGDWIGFEFTENIPALPAGEYTVLITADFVMGEYDIWTGEGTAFFTVS